MKKLLDSRSKVEGLGLARDQSWADCFSILPHSGPHFNGYILFPYSFSILGTRVQVLLVYMVTLNPCCWCRKPGNDCDFRSQIQCCWFLKVVTCHRWVWGKQKPDENCKEEQNPVFRDDWGSHCSKIFSFGLLKSTRQKYRQKRQRRGLWFWSEWMGLINYPEF